MSDTNDEMDDQQRDDSVSRLAWFLTGAVIGSAVAILYAPQSGKDTRRYINDKAQQGKQAVENTSQDIVDASKDMFDRGRRLVEEASDLFDRARRMVKG